MNWFCENKILFEWKHWVTITCNMSWIELNSNLIKLNSNLNFNLIEFKFIMGCKLMEKILKIWENWVPSSQQKNSTLLKNQNRRKKKKENARLVVQESVCWRPQMASVGGAKEDLKPLDTQACWDPMTGERKTRGRKGEDSGGAVRAWHQVARWRKGDPARL